MSLSTPLRLARTGLGSSDKTGHSWLPPFGVDLAQAAVSAVGHRPSGGRARLRVPSRKWYVCRGAGERWPVKSSHPCDDAPAGRADDAWVSLRAHDVPFSPTSLHCEEGAIANS